MSGERPLLRKTGGSGGYARFRVKTDLNSEEFEGDEARLEDMVICFKEVCNLEW